MSTEGVLYVAFGWPYLAMALNSARTFRATNPGRGITVLTNVTLPPRSMISNFDASTDHWVTVEDDESTNRLFKTSADLHSPYDKTLLLDADTVVLGPLDVPFRLLDFADVLVRPDPKGMSRPWQRDEPILDIGRMGDVPSWNSGVVFFRNGQGSRDLFHRWNEGFAARRSSYDQPALVEAVLTSQARVLPLDERWNAPTSRYRKAGGAEGPTQILHYMAKMPEWVVQDVGDVVGQLESGHGVDGTVVMHSLAERSGTNDRGKVSWTAKSQIFRTLRGLRGR